MKDELGGKFKTKFVELRATIYNYLIDEGSEDKKAKGTKKCVIKRKREFENYKSCLEATQLDNKQKYRKKIEFIVLKNRKELIKAIIFTEKTNNIALISNGYKRMHSIDSIETYAYGTSKNFVSEKEEVKCNNMIKRYKND